MSKDQKATIEIPVETVDKYTQEIMGMTNKERLETIKEIIEHSLSTIEFWHKDKEWPTNLIHCNLEYAYKIINFILKLVSVSHIIDK